MATEYNMVTDMANIAYLYMHEYNYILNGAMPRILALSHNSLSFLRFSRPFISPHFLSLNCRYMCIFNSSLK